MEYITFMNHNIEKKIRISSLFFFVSTGIYNIMRRVLNSISDTR
jgi:hypothetical protein